VRCLLPRSFAARQLERLHVVGASAVQVSNSSGGLVLDECGIVETSARVVSGNVEVVVADLRALVRFHLSNEAVVLRFAGSGESRGGNGGQSEEGREVVHVGRLFGREGMSTTMYAAIVIAD
jgi:hypothetical protein